jgi:uncharacterized membrane protein YbaN (DUF454 family)
VIGIVIPVLPQTGFFIIAFLLVGLRLEWILEKMEKHFPRFGKPMAERIRKNSWIREFLS